MKLRVLGRIIIHGTVSQLVLRLQGLPYISPVRNVDGTDILTNKNKDILLIIGGWLFALSMVLGLSYLIIWIFDPGPAEASTLTEAKAKTKATVWAQSMTIPIDHIECTTYGIGYAYCAVKSGNNILALKCDPNGNYKCILMCGTQ